MRRFKAWAKYWAIFRTQVANRAAYPVDLAGRCLSIAVYLWVFVQLWRATYRATGQQAIAGLTLRDIATRVGMQQPSLYSHFASKQAIYDAMFQQAWQAYLESARSSAFPGHFHDREDFCPRKGYKTLRDHEIPGPVPC